MNNFRYAHNGREDIWFYLSHGNHIKYGPSLDAINQARAQGLAWGGYHLLDPNPTDSTPMADQAVWYLQYREDCGSPQLPDLLNIEVADEHGWNHLAVQAVEWLSNLESFTQQHCLIYASEYSQQYLPDWPWGRVPWPPEVSDA